MIWPSFTILFFGHVAHGTQLTGHSQLNLQLGVGRVSEERGESQQGDTTELTHRLS